MPARVLVPPDPPLTDGEIVLRPRREQDVASIAQASRDPEARRWLVDEPLSAERQHGYAARATRQWQSGTAAPFVIAAAADDQPVGILNMQFGDDHEVASLAVSVFPDMRGRGIAARALRLAALWGLTELELARVVAEADADNHDSIRAIEKAGFTREGTLRSHCKTHGRRHDCVMFSLLPQDLQAP